MTNEIKQSRGHLTERIKKASVKLLGYEINQQELRLMAYLQFTMVNNQRLELDKLSDIESPILADWLNKGFIKGEVFKKIEVTKKFWDAMCEIIYLGYVDLKY